MLPWMDQGGPMPWYWPTSRADRARLAGQAALGEGPVIDPSTLPAVPDVPWLKPKQNLLDRIAGLTPEMAAQFDPASLTSARNAGLLNAGLSLLASGGRTPNYNRANLGQALQMALGQGQDAYGRVLQAAAGLKGQQAQAEQDRARQRIIAKYQGRENDPKALASLSAELAAFDGNAGALSNAANVLGTLQPKPEAQAEWQKAGYPSFEAWRADQTAKDRPEWMKQGYPSMEAWRADKNRSSGGDTSWQLVPMADGTQGRYNPKTGQVLPVYGPDGKPLPVPSRSRPFPAAAAKELAGNDTKVKVIDDAIAELDKNPNAVGLLQNLPDALTQRLPGAAFRGGVEARAGIGDIGSMVIHDRSGAAVTVAEFPRLRPFVPQVTDSPDVVRAKLQRMRDIIAEENRALRSFYESGGGVAPDMVPISEAAQGALDNL